MTKTEKQIVDLIEQLNRELEEVKNKQNLAYDELSKLAPHQVGEIVTYYYKKRRAVLTLVKATIMHGNVLYTYEFNAIGKDGIMMENKVKFYGLDYHWTGERYEPSNT